jgi:MerR family copper efflux transcriptional regulator
LVSSSVGFLNMTRSLRVNVGMKSSGDTGPTSIGTIAERFGLATHVLRHWESVGLLAPDRDPAGRRRYGLDDLVRVAVILRAKEAGLGLDDIREMITDSDPAGRRATLQRRRAALQQRVAEIQAALELIECALDCDHEDFTQCSNFRQMMAERIGIQSAEHIPV